MRLTGRDGSPAAWMLYAWPVTMTGSGLRRAAAELLGLLASFSGATQLAGFGPAGIRLVAACLRDGEMTTTRVSQFAPSKSNMGPTDR